MADILIPGVEMPENCYECPCCDKEFGKCQILDDYIFYDRPSLCPLVPLPEGHGRLGDLDALMNSIGDVPYKGSVRRVLMSAPTIVPAEGGTYNV